MSRPVAKAMTMLQAEAGESPGIAGHEGGSNMRAASRVLSICLICPRYQPSFFGTEYALPLLPGDKRSASFPGALPLLAALVPELHSVTIIDENVEQLDLAALARFDVIGLTGMILQKQRMREILTALHGSGPIICVGGPYISVYEEAFECLCDVKFIGEADVTWPQFLRDVASGRPIERRYKQDAFTDLTTLPTPRYDLVQTGRYTSATTQFGRGCPFLCDFCDIIVIYGRRPRLKHPEQIVGELDRLLGLGVRSVFFVDDNFIGNKPLAKALLQTLCEWQQGRGYPMTFSTEATINLADEPEILDLLWKANFTSVFIGIETPRTQSLLETRKTQNVRGDSLQAKVERIRDAGLGIHAGFIVGFDSDDESIFDEQFEFLQDAGIGTPFVSVLSPIPSTPLYDRLQREGRLRVEDDLAWFEPKQMSQSRLKAGYRDLNMRLYATEAFFHRIFARQLRSPAYLARRRDGRARRKPALMSRLMAAVANAIIIGNLTRDLLRNGKLTSIGAAYLSAWWRRNLRLGQDRLRLSEYVGLCIRHWHCFRIASDSRSQWGN
jgi:radical SAM superfamily enzyme YgiQ (UPF0313 family)